MEWNRKIAIRFAKEEGIVLNKMHWKIIYLVRKFYKKYNFFPSDKMLVSFIKKRFGKQFGSSIYLFKLFSFNANKKIKKIAGIPNSKVCF
ncbi:TusE/DsrC/DsvC family sulfur relay protein [bacterium endosymbiont of Pedicinus badii]|uniref:TusE/DsrC/DsvC family sulfur relay protein n=1 Tax=bacterium endosymbiont of Pedicinus badii TaxID=1719126 RepID=UPI0009BC228C|nr:TusE/DsrC/DsvC family sulfur relay protein [bacterium endosymbiont of Pedicinus badii]OQM34354.1 hypothetical protein AOQ89_00455 [bacterium endosymbiont of Pedicinus badii]